MKNTIMLVVIIGIINLIPFRTIAQQWNVYIGNPMTGGEYLGDDGTSTAPLVLKTLSNLSIDFYTNATQKATILGNGNVGIGTTIPTQLLQVLGGSIDVNTITNGYMINNNMVLWHNGNITNMYGGVYSGNSSILNIGTANVCYGQYTGSGLTFGWGNTLVGNSAGGDNLFGPALDEGYANSIVGDSAGFFNFDESYSETYLGHKAGYTTGAAHDDVFVGDSAGYNNGSGMYNVMVGSKSGWNAHVGENNSYVGYKSGVNSGNVDANTFVGAYSGFNNNISNNFYIGGLHNTFIGANSGFTNNQGNFNVFSGFNTGYYNLSGYSNLFEGIEAGKNNQLGHDNVYLGDSCGWIGGYFFGTQGGSMNTFAGAFSGYFNQDSSNAFYGDSTAMYHWHGRYNTYIGTNAQVDPSTVFSRLNNLHNSSSLGANTIVPDHNQVILGNEVTDVGIGLSNDINTTYAPAINGGPGNRLEINAGNFGYLRPTSGPGYSGLRFRALNARCDTLHNPGLGLLAVDTSGDVIYVNGLPAGSGIGTCTSPTVLAPNSAFAGNGAFDMGSTPATQANFYFLRQNLNPSPLADLTNVGIGQFPCSNLNGKLDVLQSSINPGTNGINVLNTDTSAGFPDASSIGIRSLATGPSVAGDSGIVYTTASWFESKASGGQLNYAIVVPYGGGLVSIGYAHPTTPSNNPTSKFTSNRVITPRVTFDVNGDGRFATLPISTTTDTVQMVVCDNTGQLFVQHGGIPRGTGFGPCPGDTLLPAGPGNPYGIQMNGNNIYFSGSTSGSGGTQEINSTGFGINCGNSLAAKVDILRGFNGVAATLPTPMGLQVVNHDLSNNPVSGYSKGINDSIDGANYTNVALNINAINALINYGAVFNVGNPSSPLGLCYDLRIGAHDGQGNTGVNGFVYDGTNMGWSRNAGCEFFVSSANFGGSFNYGGKFDVKGSANNNWGVHGEVTYATSPAATNIGVYGYTPIAGPDSNSVGSINLAVYGDLGPVCPGCNTGLNFAGFFNGNVANTGLMFFASDANLKHNIQPLVNPLAVLNQINVKTYEFNQQQNLSMQLPNGTHAGVLAQDLFNILPEATKDCVQPARYDSLGNQTYAAIHYKGVNYIELIPYLIGSVKQLDSTNQVLQNQINNLTTMINNCCNNGNRTPNTDNGNGGNNNNNGGNNSTLNNINVTLTSKSIVLMQNVPNPFKEQTVISYFIPDNLTDVSIIFTDNLGNIIKNVPITEHGNGQLTVYAQDLSSGIYTYTIISNGVTIDSKRMVKTK